MKKVKNATNTKRTASRKKAADSRASATAPAEGSKEPQTVPVAQAEPPTAEDTVLVQQLRKAQTEPPAEEEQEFQPQERDPLSQDARDWLMNPSSIPHAGSHEGYPLIRFLGWKIIDDVANDLGRCLILDEVKVMVQKDGPMVKCLVTGQMFQPIKYWGFAPENLKSIVEKGGSFSDVKLKYGGHFFAQYPRIVPLCGPIYAEDNSNLCRSGSNVIDAAYEIMRRRRMRRPLWGKCLEVVKNYLAEGRPERRTQRKNERLEAKTKIQDIFSGKFKFESPAPLKNGLEFDTRTENGSNILLPAPATVNGNGSH
jgi:hypothetical protein